MTIRKTIAIFLCSLIIAVATVSVPASKTQPEMWREVDDAALSRRPSVRTPTPENYRTFQLEKARLGNLLSTVPNEFSRMAASGDPVDKIIELPMPDGTLARFRFEHSLVVEPGLMAKYPELGATYRGYGIDDPTATVRFGVLPAGFHAIILSSNGTVLIDPYASGDSEHYVTYQKNDLPRENVFKCEVGESALEPFLNPEGYDAREFFPDAPAVTSGSQLRTYRLALAATNEYAVRVGGNTVAGTLAAQVLIMNRVNGVYERDLAIHMNIIADNDKIVYAGDNTNCPIGTGGTACAAANDPYTNTSGSTMLGENTTNLNTVIETANYDIGHVFSTGGGGIAGLGVPCGSSKARGVTGLSNPVGDAFAIDYVAHEMGHQWGANHTFNGTVSSCGGNRSGSSAYEPGSGITIMGYAGICGSQNLARNSIDTFHVKSLEAITTYSQGGGGSVCGQTSATGNTPPTVSVVGGPTFNIPKQTPFTLTADATDVNGDTITYDWQEYDLGASTASVPNTDETGIRPIFRPYLPTSSPSRTFPSLAYILANANVPPASYPCGTLIPCLTGELLPQVARTMNFQVVARDNRANGGGINSATATVIVDANGPFAVTSPNTNTPLYVGTSHAITWNVAGTMEAPVSTANVKISLSTDGGLSFPTVLIASTRNDGSETIIVPDILTTTARIKIEAIGNIFFDISDADFAISVSPVTIAGRVFSNTGLPVRNAKLTLTDPLGNTRVATTGSLGTYLFDEVAATAAYTLTVSSKRFRYAPQILNVGTLDVANLNFIGLE